MRQNHGSRPISAPMSQPAEKPRPRAQELRKYSAQATCFTARVRVTVRNCSRNDNAIRIAAPETRARSSMRAEGSSRRRGDAHPRRAQRAEENGKRQKSAAGWSMPIKPACDDVK